MKALNRFASGLATALAAIVGIAYAAQPPNVVVSDELGNTAMGSLVLYRLTTGAGNTASGYAALNLNTTGRVNTAFGEYALHDNTTGSNNTAIGSLALVNSIGIDNTAIGAEALVSNTTGIWNTASGSRALHSNTTGRNNTAAGFAVLDSNTDGEANTAVGGRTMFSNTSGINNAAFGYAALYQNVSGFRNAALGYQAGWAVTGSDNITIGGDNQGKAAENGVIRIGTKTYQKKTYVAGIRGVTTGLAAAIPVLIDANGQLGTIKSSARFKEDIQSMGSASERLLALRPVTFRYKQAYDDGSKPITYGLIAEEVADVFPELVVNDADGKPETVRYDLVATLLLNEFQKEHAIVQAQNERIATLEKQTEKLARLQQDFAKMSETLERLDHVRMVAATH